MLINNAEHSTADLGPSPFYRETEPIALWSGLIRMNINPRAFEQTVCRAAAVNEQRYTGYITKDENGNVTSFTRTRYPRKKYGVSSIDECMSGMVSLASNLGTELLPDPRRNGFRVVFGLVEGYETDAPIHSIEEVQSALSDCAVSPAEVFVVWPSDDKTPIYREPVAIIDGHLESIKKVYDLADKMKQERITIEDFEHGVAYVVETRHCTEPDD